MFRQEIYFFIGTEAELIKLFPVMLELKKQGKEYHIIASGQNDIKNSDILKKSGCGIVELELSSESNIRKSASGLLKWWFSTYRGVAEKIRTAFPECSFRDSHMVVHGDTVSTFMGAKIGRKLGMTVCHVEAGLRSHNLFNPFPEEIDRLLTSREARLHFAPGEYAVRNLRNAKGKVINTEMNTLIDALKFSDDIETGEAVRNYLESHNDYFVFVIHRQENLSNTGFFKNVIKIVKSISKQKHCLFILHEITRKKLESLGELDEFKENPDFTLMSRVQYFDFMKLLRNSQFVITDGGSNQEELYYMGKPCLILRKTTERNEGLGENAVLLKDENVVKLMEFAADYRKYFREPVVCEKSPAVVIAEMIG